MKAFLVVVVAFVFIVPIGPLAQVNATVGGKKTTLTFRADAINFLNTPQWGLPNTNINSTTFGRITTATGSRMVLLNARVDF
jgi:hypothetical protein